MSSGEPLDDVVSAKKATQPRDLGAQLLAFVVVVAAWEQEREDVAVAEAVDVELASTDSLEQRQVRFRPRSESASWSAPDRSTLRDGHDDVVDGLGILDNAERVEVRTVGSICDPGESPKVGDTLAERSHANLAVRIPLRSASQLELAGLVDGGLDTQDVADARRLRQHEQPSELAG